MVLFTDNQIDTPIFDFENSLEGVLNFGPVDSSELEYAILGAFDKKTV